MEIQAEPPVCHSPPEIIIEGPKRSTSIFKVTELFKNLRVPIREPKSLNTRQLKIWAKAPDQASEEQSLCLREVVSIDGHRGIELSGKHYAFTTMPISPEHMRVWTTQIKDRLEDELPQFFRTERCSPPEIFMVSDRKGRTGPCIILTLWNENTCQDDTGREMTRKRIQKKVRGLQALKVCPYPCKVVVDTITLLARPMLSNNPFRTLIRAQLRESQPTFVGIVIKVSQVDSQECTLGGLIRVGRQIFGLTVAHACVSSVTSFVESSTGRDKDGNFDNMDSDSGSSLFDGFEFSEVKTLKAESLAIEVAQTRSTDSQDEVVRFAADRNLRNKQHSSHTVFSEKDFGHIDITCSLITADEGNNYPYLDWALVKIDPTQTLLRNSYINPDSQETVALETALVDSTTHNSNVLVLGGKSGPQQGIVGQKDVSMLLEGRRFLVSQILLNTPLERGDSGSWVIQKNAVVGCIIAGRRLLPIAYMIPINCILQDISNSTGESEVAIADYDAIKRWQSSIDTGESMDNILNQADSINQIGVLEGRSAPLISPNNRQQDREVECMHACSSRGVHEMPASSRHHMIYTSRKASFKSNSSKIVPSDESGPFRHLEAERQYDRIPQNPGDVEPKAQLNSLIDSDKVPEKSTLQVNCEREAEKPADEPAPECGTSPEDHPSHNSATGDEGEKGRHSGATLAFLISGVCLSVLLVALDAMIVTIAIPRITDQFHSLRDVGWYGSTYHLSASVLQLFIGKIYTFYSIKVVFIASLIIFETGSTVCATAPTSAVLIVGRAIAGAGSIGVLSGAALVISHIVLVRKRSIYFGTLGLMFAIAAIAGPVIGGALTDRVGWKWCFYMNLPFGAIATVVIILSFRPTERTSETKATLSQCIHPIDALRTANFVALVVVLLLALQWGGSTYSWSNWRIILCLALSVPLATTLFGSISYRVLAESISHRRSADANGQSMISIITQRNIAAACGWAFSLGGGSTVLLYWLPVWFQGINSASPLKSGIMFLPTTISAMIAAAASGVAVQQVRFTNPFYYGSVILSCVGASLLTTWKIDTESGKWIGYQIIYGIGIGCGQGKAFTTVQATLSASEIQFGMALVQFMQHFGSALFVSVAQNVFNNRLIRDLNKHVPNVDPRIISNVGATSLTDNVDPQALQLAYNTALTSSWYVAVAIFGLAALPAAIIEWKPTKARLNFGLALIKGVSPPPWFSSLIERHTFIE